MADNNTEIERLCREIQKANADISHLEREYDEKLAQELDRIKSEFAQSAAMQQEDFTLRFKQFEESLCDAYLSEVNDLKGRYEALVSQVDSYEAQIESQIQQVVQTQSAFLDKKAAEDDKILSLAEQSIQKLYKCIENAHKTPIDLFYPHALQRYIDAGKEAEELLRLELYSPALAKADCACMSVDRLTDNTSVKVRELESMFALYKAKYETINNYLSSDESRSLIDHGEVILELSETDLDYWSDLLYSDIKNALHKHKDIISDGVDGWLVACRDMGISPSLLLDKEMQKLDAIPSKLNTCISYALSACDCYNYLGQIKKTADEILHGQNYSFKSTLYGCVKPENSITNGFCFYYNNYLANEQCICPSSKPDYREERVILYEKAFIDGRTDKCRLYVIPIRTNDTVSVDMYIQFDTDSLSSVVSSKIRQLFIQAGINVKILINSDKIPIQDDRLLSLEILKKQHAGKSESTLASKYSLNI